MAQAVRDVRGQRRHDAQAKQPPHPRASSRRIQHHHRTGIDQAVHGERNQTRRPACLTVRPNKVACVLVGHTAAMAATPITATAVVHLIQPPRHWTPRVTDDRASDAYYKRPVGYLRFSLSSSLALLSYGPAPQQRGFCPRCNSCGKVISQSLGPRLTEAKLRPDLAHRGKVIRCQLISERAECPLAERVCDAPARGRDLRH